MRRSPCIPDRWRDALEDLLGSCGEVRRRRGRVGLPTAMKSATGRARLRGCVRELRVLQERCEHGDRDRPPGRRLRVEVSNLEPTTCAHRREQRAQVVVQVFLGRRVEVRTRPATHSPKLKPGAATQGGGRGPQQHHHGCSQDVLRPGDQRVARARRVGSWGVEVEPHCLSRRLPPGQGAVQTRRVRGRPRSGWARAGGAAASGVRRPRGRHRRPG